MQASIRMIAAMLLAGSLLASGNVVASDKVNINTADAAALVRGLLDLTPSQARAIVRYRKQHGVFRSPEQLAMVRGVGMTTVTRNADRIVLDQARPEPRRAQDDAGAGSSAGR